MHANASYRMNTANQTPTFPNLKRLSRKTYFTIDVLQVYKKDPLDWQCVMTYPSIIPEVAGGATFDGT